VIVRASVQIEPGTGRLRIAMGPLPSFADGAPLQFKALLLQFDRGELRISPDGCEPLALTATISGAQGSSATIPTEPFGAARSPCPPQAPAPASSTRAAGVSSSTVSLANTRVMATGRGRAAVKLTCTGPVTCRGKLTLTVRKRGRGAKRRSKTTTIATATFSILAGKTTTVELELNRAGRALLGVAQRTGGRLHASLTVLKLSPAPADTSTDGVQLIRAEAAKAESARSSFS
jgi:hypothetical protein